MLKAVRVPPPFEPPFARAEEFVEKLFANIERRPERGTIHIGGERYVLVRAESHAALAERIAALQGVISG